ncbi:hypothetical protein MNBD_GAMMA23-1506 [hydrothermal vent metagenome]|uniref:Peptidoglycan-binding protein, CsiV n=1 Tax=hydrothermal vent metagenome TaxID=652676 RepID=A0A3B1AWU7_9ZZZZ
MRYFSISFAFMLLFLANTNAAVYQEEVRYYDVEILLFENIKPNPTNTETWPSSLEFEVPEDSLFIGSPYPGPIPTAYNPRFTFKPIKSSTYQLQEEAKRLTEHKDYRILYHRSWRQPGMEREKAVSVKILREIPRIKLPVTVTENNPALSIEQIDYNRIINERLPATNNLQGLIKITLSRYLHIQTDIQYTRHIVEDNSENPDASFANIKPQVYQLKQTRKMRSKELHYIDNPRLGLLVYITPVPAKK